MSMHHTSSLWLAIEVYISFAVCQIVSWIDHFGTHLSWRKTGPVFYDPELTQYIGHEVECDGFLVGNTLLAERIAVVE